LEKYDIYLFDNTEKESNHNLLKTELEKRKKYIKTYNISKLNTIQVCELIRNEEIDILFDLNGHTDGNRLDVFSKKPSPIQVSYIGYPNTTGLKTIDYRIVDKITDKITNQEHYSEKLVFLEKCFLLYNSYQQQFPVNIIDNGDEIILGSMNRENKNSKELLKVWKNILKKCKQENLNKIKILIKVNGSDQETLLERKKYYKNILEISDNNIIIVSSSMSTEEYFDTFGKIDVLLDTFPYSGTTTSCNSLYNSTPIVTLYKDNCHCQNVTSSLLIHSGLEELVTYSEQEYIDKVLDFCRNKSKIYEYKKNIHYLFNNYMNPKNFMKKYEKIIDEL
jgi:protein O-GlcNAc transferase